MHKIFMINETTLNPRSERMKLPDLNISKPFLSSTVPFRFQMQTHTKTAPPKCMNVHARSFFFVLLFSSQFNLFFEEGMSVYKHRGELKFLMIEFLLLSFHIQ